MGDLAGGDCREAAAPEEEAAAPAPAVGGADHLVIMVHGIIGRCVPILTKLAGLLRRPGVDLVLCFLP